MSSTDAFFKGSFAVAAVRTIMEFAAEASILYTTKTFRNHADNMHPLLIHLRRTMDRTRARFTTFVPRTEYDRSFWMAFQQGAPMNLHMFESHECSQAQYIQAMNRATASDPDLVNWFAFFACENETVFHHVWHRALAMYAKGFAAEGRGLLDIADDMRQQVFKTVAIASNVRDVLDVHMYHGVMQFAGKHNLRRGCQCKSWVQYKECHNLMTDTLMDHKWMCRFLYGPVTTHTATGRPLDTCSHVIKNIEYFRRTVFTKNSKSLYSYFTVEGDDQFLRMMPTHQCINDKILNDIHRGRLQMCIFEPSVIAKAMNRHSNRFKLILSRCSHDHIMETLQFMQSDAVEMHRVYTAMHEATQRTLERLRAARVQARKACITWDGKERRMRIKESGQPTKRPRARADAHHTDTDSDSDNDSDDTIKLLFRRE